MFMDHWLLVQFDSLQRTGINQYQIKSSFFLLQTEEIKLPSVALTKQLHRKKNVMLMDSSAVHPEVHNHMFHTDVDSASGVSLAIRGVTKKQKNRRPAEHQEMFYFNQNFTGTPYMQYNQNPMDAPFEVSRTQTFIAQKRGSRLDRRSTKTTLNNSKLQSLYGRFVCVRTGFDSVTGMIKLTGV